MRDVSKYGSRGEQRMAVWWLKQCEIEYLKQINTNSQISTNKYQFPILLLDDIFSELDHKHREEVVEYVRGYAGQVVMTTADEHLVPALPEARVIQLS
jgi:DNA replication and repair protein RecF